MNFSSYLSCTMRKIMIVLCFLFILCVVSVAQKSTQTMRGIILDAQTREPLPYATVLLPESGKGTTSDADGNFTLENIDVGRYNIQFGFVGYKPLIIPDILVGSGKEVLLEVLLEQLTTELEGVVITPTISKDRPINSMASVSARTLLVEESSRYAGSFDDPGRMAANFAGVASAGVAVNAIVVHGNSPKGVLWRIEGIDVPVPSHFAGSNVAGGGGITMFSSRLLANSDFYTGAFPAEFANAGAGVFDMKLRNGNNHKAEFGLQAGIHGVEAAAEGPLAKGYNSSYLFNYRYSTLALIFPLLPEMKNSDELPVYQDLSFKLNLPAGRAGNFSVWGIGGLSSSRMRGTNDTLNWIYPENRIKMDFYYNMGVTGISHSKTLKSKTLINSGLALSVFTTGYREAGRLSSDTPDIFTDLFEVRSLNKRLNYYTRINHVLSSKIILRGGINIGAERFDLTGDALNYSSGHKEQTMQGEGNSLLVNTHLQSKWHVNNLFFVTGGFNLSWFNLNNETKIEPRLSASYQITPKQMISLGYGLHHQTEQLSIYYVSKYDSVQYRHYYPNKKLKRYGAHHLVLSYDYKVTSNIRLKIEPYLQKLYNVPVVDGTAYSMINFLSDWTFNRELVNKGKGTNYGVDVTVERFLDKGYYLLSTLSLYKSDYTGGDDLKYRSRFDGGYVFNLLGGKEFTIKGKNNLGLNLKLTLMGPYLFQPVNTKASLLAQDIIYDSNSPFVYRNSSVEYMSDVTFSYSINNVKTASIFVVQLKNFMGRQYQGKKFNLRTQQIEDDYFSSIVPFVSYKFEF